MQIQRQFNKLQINFTANLDRAGNTTMLFVIEEVGIVSVSFSLAFLIFTVIVKKLLFLIRRKTR